MIQIVNHEDQVIGHKERSQVDPKKEIYRVATLWLKNPRNEILIARRKLTKDKDPGKWGPAVAGTLEQGETYETNIYKEAEEEIGLENVRFNFGPKIRIKEPRNYFCQVFTAILDKTITDFKIQEDEVEEIKWVSERELLDQLNSNPSNFTASTKEIFQSTL